MSSLGFYDVVFNNTFRKKKMNRIQFVEFNGSESMIKCTTKLKYLPVYLSSEQKVGSKLFTKLLYIQFF